jgi:ketosteroid isomerase-like protein
MSKREQNEQLLREGLDAFNRGDFAALEQVFDERLESHVAPGLANAGTWHGREGFAEMVATWMEAFETQHNSVVSIQHPDDHHMIAEIRQTAVGAGSGVPVEMTLFYLYEIRDGRAVRLHLYADRESALAAVRK